MNRRKINIFRIGNQWCFKYFFTGGGIFSKLNKYYNNKKYRFELKNLDDLRKVVEYLDYKGFEFIYVKDSSDLLSKP